MRIVGGLYRGRVLYTFDGEDIRPTPDKVRESIFNIIQQKTYGCCFLDVFSGTGAMGLEALSRGAKEVVLNDKSRQSVALINKNVQKLGVKEGVKVTNFDGVQILKTFSDKFDIIYLDPPYKTELGLEALKFCASAIKDDGIIIFEDEKEFNGQVEGLAVYDQRKYGRVRLTFFKKGE